MDLQQIHFKHEVPVQIRFNDIDGFRHVNNTKYAEFYDFGRTNYLDSISDEVFLNWDRIDLVIASVKTDFFSPITLHEHIMVKTKVYKLGNKSLEMMQVITDKYGTVKSLSTSVMVGFREGESAVLHPALRNAIERFEGITSNITKTT